MSTLISTATNPTQRSIIDATLLLLRGAQHKSSKTVGIAVLLAAALTANMADAASRTHHRHYRASAPDSSWVSESPAYYARYDRGVLAPYQVSPASGRGSFEEHNSAP
jgi:hypothetical protein